MNMGIKSKQASTKIVGGRSLAPPRGPVPAPPPPPVPTLRAAAAPSPEPRLQRLCFSQRLKPDSLLILNSAVETKSGAEEVINLGAPRGRSAPLRSPPRPVSKRLYPGTQKVKLKGNAKSASGVATSGGRSRSGERAGLRRRRKRYYRLPLPNSRLYRPPQPQQQLPAATPPSAPSRPLPSPLQRRRYPPPPRSPPPRRPQVSWPRPSPPHLLDTASGAALRLAAHRHRSSVHPPLAHQPSPVPVHRYNGAVQGINSVWAPDGIESPVVERFVVRPSLPLHSLDTDSGEASPAPPPRARASAMRRHSASPDYSDANDTLSAPSEYLAEFLSAIMRRQYAEALKYCRLILQYEPHNATARGFYPLLQRKVGRGGRTGEPHANTAQQEATPAEACESGGDESSPAASVGSAGSAGSVDSCASLSMDSSGTRSPACAVRARDSSPVDRSLSTSSGTSERWEYSRGSCGSAAAADRDDNGNDLLLTAKRSLRLTADDICDVENDNAAGGDHTPSLKSAATSLAQLRAQFAASAHAH